MQAVCSQLRNMLHSLCRLRVRQLRLSLCEPKAADYCQRPSASRRLMVCAGWALKDLQSGELQQESSRISSVSPRPFSSFLCYYHLIFSKGAMLHVSNWIPAFIRQPLWWAKSFTREAELLDMEPFADDARHRQKGPLLRCQDNATAAIVKSQGFCGADFSASL